MRAILFNLCVFGLAFYAPASDLTSGQASTLADPKLFLPSVFNSAPTLYVATTGNDTNPGSLAQPYRTIQKAVSAARAGDIIRVRGGIYNEEVVFDHGGTPARPLILQNYPGETPIIDGSMDVSGWTQLPGTNVWRATFTHRPGIFTNGDFEDVAAESTCPDSYQYSGDRRAYFYVDENPDASHWLKPVCIIGSTPEYQPQTLPAGTFGTDVAPPPLAAGQHFAGTSNTLYVRLADNSNPNNHRIRIPAFTSGLKFRGDVSAQVHDVNVSGLSLRLAETSVQISSGYPYVSSGISLDRLDLSLNDGRVVVADFCANHLSLTNSHLHDFQYEAVHLEGDNSTVANNLIEHTLAPWALYGSIGINVLGNNNRITDNTIHDIYQAENRTGGHGIFMEEWYNGTGDVGCHSETNQSNLIAQNRISDNDGNGIHNSGGDNNSIQNNIIYHAGSSGITISMGGTDGGPTGTQRRADNNLLYNNTIVASREVAFDIGDQSSGIIRNNIAYNNGRVSGKQIYLVGRASFVIDYNLNLDIDQNVDPLFVYPSGGDFHLRTGSPAIDAGINAGVTNDFDANARPVGAGYDIGAYEYQGVSPH